MEAYTGFAKVYDLFMDNVPYEEWCAYLVSLLKKFGIEDGLVLDLGCGTGKLTRLLDLAGYDMIGVDNSEEMLEMAMETCEAREERETAPGQETDLEQKTDPGPGAEQAGSNILYLLQDMREFELYGTVRAVVSICDSMNYILEEEELLQVFGLVNNYLDPGGIFIFDMNTPYKYREILGESTICENREEGSFIWENFYDAEEEINEYDLTLFIREEQGLYRKYEETHFQRCYTPDRVQRLLEESGMEFVAAYDAFTLDPVRQESERMYFIAREKGKQDSRDE